MPSSDTTARLDTGFAGAFTALCVAAVSMGLSPIFVRFAAADVGPFASAFWRVALALPVLYAWLRLEEAKTGGTREVEHAVSSKSLHPDLIRVWSILGSSPRTCFSAACSRPSFSRATMLAGAAFAGDLFFWHLSILNTTVANATFFATTAPVFVVLVAWLVLRRRVSGGTIAGLALCCLGGVSLIGQSLDVNPARIVGDIYGVATAVFFAIYFLAVERAREGGGAARVTFELTLITAAILLVVALLLDNRVLPRTREGVAALIAMAWISHAGGQGLLSIALGRLPAVFSSLVIFLEAIAAAAFGWMILDERLTMIQVLGGALILAGIWMARPRARSAPL